MLDVARNDHLSLVSRSQNYNLIHHYRYLKKKSAYFVSCQLQARVRIELGVADVVLDGSSGRGSGVERQFLLVRPVGQVDFVLQIGFLQSEAPKKPSILAMSNPCNFNHPLHSRSICEQLVDGLNKHNGGAFFAMQAPINDLVWYAEIFDNDELNGQNRIWSSRFWAWRSLNHSSALSPYLFQNSPIGELGIKRLSVVKSEHLDVVRIIP